MKRKMHVLIVDDEKRLVTNLQAILKRRGFETTGVTSGEDALEVLSQASNVDVILLDVKMEGMNGIEVLREVKRRFGTVQVILYTGHATIQQGIEGLELGAFYYVQKPSPVEELVDLIQSACDRRIREHGDEILQA
jgi:DNA-binding NtrC family response regulator